MAYFTRIGRHSPEVATAFAVLIGTGVLPRRGRALDIGCDEGSESIFMANLGWRVLGIDIDEEVVKRARGRSADLLAPAKRRLVRFKCCDALDFRAFRPGSFDLVNDRLVFANFTPGSDMLEMTHERRRPDVLRRRFLDVCARALRPARVAHRGGLVFMRFGNSDNWGIPRDCSLGPREKKHAAKYFRAVGESVEVAYTGFVTPFVIDRKDKDCIASAPYEMSALVLERNEITWEDS